MVIRLKLIDAKERNTWKTLQTNARNVGKGLMTSTQASLDGVKIVNNLMALSDYKIT